MAPIFAPLPDKPDHDALEREILDVWKRDGTFEKLREQNRGGPKFSFVDGPVTANKTLAVHTAWGRTLKDVFQRYKAMRGFEQRYQNGFDCQGLWIEVGVERELGLNSKPEIEEYGLAEFARTYPDVVLDVSTDESRLDLVANGFDAGVQYGEFIQHDMVAVRVSPDHRPAIVGSPAYFADHPKPTSPHDLLQHRCVNYRHGSGELYRWELDKGDQSVVVGRQRRVLQVVAREHPLRSSLVTRGLRSGEGVLCLFELVCRNQVLS